MIMKIRGIVVSSCVVLAAGACAGTAGPSGGPRAESPDAAGRFELRVSLYPWVPEPDSLVRWVERDFEALHPDVDLVVRGVDRSHDWVPNRYTGDLAYEIDRAVAALTTHSTDFQHLVEIDAMILGDLAQRGAVVPFEVAGRDFLPFAKEAVTWDGKTYGVPHWTCGYFVISEDAGIRRAATVHDWLRVLEARNTAVPDLVGDLDGSWDAVMVYLDAFRDTYPDSALAAALGDTLLNTEVAASLGAVGRACAGSGGSLCGADSVPLFARGGADALIGYSERLNAILGNPARTVGQLHVASAVLGAGDRPTLFTDALAMSPQCASERCRGAARRFAEYYTSDRVFEHLMMSRDVGPSAPPRYLLPSTTTAFRTGSVAGDRLYQELVEEIAGARPFPNHGVPDAKERGTIRAGLRKVLGIP